MIVKVQVSIFGTAPDPMCLIYNKSRNVSVEFPADKSIMEKMNGSKKEFFHAEIVGGRVHIGEKAPWQSW